MKEKNPVECQIGAMGAMPHACVSMRSGARKVKHDPTTDMPTQAWDMAPRSKIRGRKITSYPYPRRHFTDTELKTPERGVAFVAI
jgi:hypothetical protein